MTSELITKALEFASETKAMEISYDVLKLTGTTFKKCSPANAPKLLLTKTPTQAEDPKCVNL